MTRRTEKNMAEQSLMRRSDVKVMKSYEGGRTKGSIEDDNGVVVWEMGIRADQEDRQEVDRSKSRF